MFKMIYTKKIIQYLLISALFVPILFTPFTLYPSYYGKTAIFQILVSVTFLLYLFLVFRKKVDKPKLSPIFWIVAIYLGIRIITGFLGLDSEKSFWGTQARMGGNFTWIHFFIFFFLLTQFFKEKKDWIRLIKMAVFASFLVALTGILQYFSITFFDLWRPGERISGIIGNPIPFASYILFSIWLGALLFYKSLATTFNYWRVNKYLLNKMKSFLPALFWGVILITNTTTLFLSGTRGATYVFIASIPLAVLLIGIFYKKRFIYLFSLFLVIFIFVSTITLALNQENNFVKSSETLKRISRLSETTTSNTLNTRFLNWKIAYQGWIENPRSFLIGYGTENYDRIFDKYYNPEFLRYSFYETVGDRPHNILFEVVVASGILGLLSYLSIFVGVFFVLIQSARRKRISKTSAIILSLAFLTYLGQNLAEFDTTNVLILFFFALALVSVFGENKKESASVLKMPNIFIFILFILISVSLWFFTIEPIQASYYTLKSAESSKENVLNWNKYAKRALELNSVFKNENRIHTANSVFYLDAKGLFSISEKNIDTLKILYEKLGESVRNHPNTYAYKHRFAQVESMMGEYVDKKYFNDAEKTFIELDRENPDRQAVGLTWAQMRMIRGDAVGAAEILEKVVDKNPDFDEPHWYLGLVLLEIGERERGILELEKSIEMGGFVIEKLSNIELLVALWQEDGKYKKIAVFYENLAQNFERMNKEGTVKGAWREIAKAIYPRLAATYAEMGDIEKAIETVEKAVQLNPDLVDEAREFIESLKSK